MGLSYSQPPLLRFEQREAGKRQAVRLKQAHPSPFHCLEHPETPGASKPDVSERLARETKK